MYWQHIKLIFLLKSSSVVYLSVSWIHSHNFIRNVDIVHWNKTRQPAQCVDKTKLPPKTCTEGQTRKKVIILQRLVKLIRSVRWSLETLKRKLGTSQVLHIKMSCPKRALLLCMWKVWIRLSSLTGIKISVKLFKAERPARYYCFGFADLFFCYMPP